MVYNLGEQNTIFNQFVSELRDVNIQKDSMRFRRNLERMGEIAAYEISKTFDYQSKSVTTPLGEATMQLMSKQPVIATILRAGLPLHQGVLNYFDRAENAFISAFRKHHKDGTFNIQLEYVAAPDINNKVLILTDPMLATGASLVMVYKALLQRGTPSHTHIVCAIASAEGVEYLKKHLPLNVSIWCGAIDEELTAQSYIVPGLGDAGDLSFGEKL